MRKREKLARLRRLRDVISRVPPERFDIGTWWQNDCQSIGCACGWAAQEPWFQVRGLSVQKFKNQATSKMSYELVYQAPNGRVHTDYEASAEFFGLNGEDNQYLFSPSEYHPFRYDDEGDPEEYCERNDLLDRLTDMIHNLSR